jgi:aldose sugar dehydrogenase
MRSLSRPLLLQLACHAVTGLLLLCLPVLKWKVPWWDLPRSELLPLVLLLGAYGVSALAVIAFVRGNGLRSAARALAITLSIFSVALLLLLLARWNLPRYLLLPVFAAAAVMSPLLVMAPQVRIAALAALTIGFLVTGGLGARALLTKPPAGTAKVTESNLKTAFYVLRVVTHENAVPSPETRGGGLAPLGSHVLLATGGGGLYALDIAGDDLIAHELPARVPVNRAEFAAAFGGSANEPSRASDWRSLAPGVQTWRFRVADVLTQVRGDSVRIFASHHFWNEKDFCFTVRISQLDADLRQLDASMRGAAWRTIYETEPCIPMRGPHRLRAKNPFRGEEIGGRLGLVDADTLLMTLGDFGFTGLESPQGYAQDPAAAYGKTMRIDLKTGASSVFTTGHRNPQGLFVSKDGRVWSSEHAAQGGDEINLLVAGHNYGWPLVTYGTDYGSFIWPLNPHQGHHEGFAKPAYAWIPGIGVSDVIGIERDRFAIWQGDLLAGSLGTRSLYRIALDGDHTVLSEQVALGKRVRDLMELDDGRILVWSDDASLSTLEPANAAGVDMQFLTQCSGCHRVNDAMTHRIGPDLFQLLDRKVASAPGFDAYSAALKQAGGNWDKARLDAFLRNPQDAVPGTSMAFPGIEDDRERAQMVDYVMAATERGGL